MYVEFKVVLCSLMLILHIYLAMSQFQNCIDSNTDTNFRKSLIPASNFHSYQNSQKMTTHYYQGAIFNNTVSSK